MNESYVTEILPTFVAPIITTATRPRWQSMYVTTRSLTEKSSSMLAIDQSFTGHNLPGM